MIRAMPTAGESPASSFDRLAQRSEQARVQLVIGALLALIALTLIRRLADGAVMSSPVFWWTLGLLVIGLGYEAWVLRQARTLSALNDEAVTGR